MENENPEIKQHLEHRIDLEWADGRLVQVDEDSIFEVIRDIKDPEHPYTLEQLGVVSKADITVGETEGYNTGNNSVPSAVDAARAPLCSTGLPLRHVTVTFTPTVPHCSMAGMIGLALVYQIMRYTSGLWIRIRIKENTHSNYMALNKQLSDRDRVLAALENEAVIDLLDFCVPSLHEDLANV